MQLDAQDTDRLDADRGYREIGELRMRDWWVRGPAAERRSFARLCKTLWQRQYRARLSIEDPALIAKWREDCRAYQARKRAVDREASKLAPPVVCSGCGATWCAVYGTGRPRKWCSDACCVLVFQRSQRTPKHRCSRCGELGHNRRRCGRAA